MDKIIRLGVFLGEEDFTEEILIQKVLIEKFLSRFY
jgi:hypothetical protein